MENKSSIENQKLDNEKNDNQNDCPTENKQQKNNHKILIFTIISTVCLILCITFFVLFILTINDARTVYFTNNKNYRRARFEIGTSEKRENIDKFSYHHRLNEDDDIVLEVSYDNYRFSYYLSNAEMQIGFYKNSILFIKYEMTKTGLRISEVMSNKSTDIEFAETLREASDMIINLDLEKNTTIEDILTEYYNYCNKVKTIKIVGIVFSILFLSGFVVCLVFTIKFFKNKNVNNNLNSTTAIE